MQANESPIDFFDEGLKDYPSTKMVNFLEATLSPGDCMYVPAYYYVQSKTLGDDNYMSDVHGEGQSLIITHQYESHSEMVEMVFEGIDSKDWTD